MKYICQLGIILGVSFAGEVLARVLPLPVPASVWGLVTMLALLILRIIKPAQIRDTAEYLIAIMPLLFVPPTVGLMQSWGLLRDNLLSFVIAVTLITAIVMAVTGLVAQLVEGGKEE